MKLLRYFTTNVKEMTINVLLIALLLTTSCSQNQQSETANDAPQEEVVEELPGHTANFPEEFASALKAHGGFETWQKYKTLEYDLVKKDGGDHQMIDLQDRRVLLNNDTYKIGFDGNEVWISPNKEALGRMSARFYHNLYFYFFAIPFVLGDPGINYEVLEPREMDGKTYDVVKVSFNEGVGDSSGDYYVAHFDQETHKMHLLLYTVTYFSNESHENYNAIIYDWQEVDGLTIPKTLKGYKYENGELGDLRYEAEFANVKFSEKAQSDDMFAMPEEAEIDSLVKEQ
ncbi:DUF6503 family protein [Fulvivirgaceae bacterium BMA10]|uniref:DUF6503 family protein n=1 Tax=Splendidivirga corallicola TaxID=3051826 RepID=A0ABT8KR70_9BACT|nr:DUF6503 family protein [Fulvivirgaceae bacterium BMA10]